MKMKMKGQDGAGRRLRLEHLCEGLVCALLLCPDVVGNDSWLIVLVTVVVVVVVVVVRERFLDDFLGGVVAAPDVASGVRRHGRGRVRGRFQGETKPARARGAHTADIAWGGAQNSNTHVNMHMHMCVFLAPCHYHFSRANGKKNPFSICPLPPPKTNK